MKTLSTLLNSYGKEAFRLETLPSYTVESEVESLQHFLKTGEILPVADTETYIQTQALKIQGGKRHIRGRVVPSPITDYFRFETQVGYIPQAQNNFELYFLDQEDVVKQIEENDLSNRDFWLFDEKEVIFMQYDSAGKFLGGEYSDDPAIINQAIQVRDFFIKNGKPLSYILE